MHSISALSWPTLWNVWVTPRGPNTVSPGPAVTVVSPAVIRTVPLEDVESLILTGMRVRRRAAVRRHHEVKQ